MPKLHKYAASNAKDGFYIYAKHNGQNVTYQVTALARRIFERLGYGDNTEITGEMLYALHRLKLVYTNKSGIDPPSSFDDIAAEVEVSNSAKNDRTRFFHTLLEEANLDPDARDDLTRYLEKEDIKPESSKRTPAPSESGWRPSNPEAKVVYRGTVDFFNDTGGYGFIECPLFEDDTFYHMEDIGGRDIEEGTHVEFARIEAEKGPRATHIRVIDGEDVTKHKRERTTNDIDDLEDRPPLEEFQHAEMYDAELSVTFLGTGGQWPTEERFPNTIAVQRDPELFLFDVGEGALRQMQRYDTGLAVDAIFLTSTETDHIGGLGPLLKALSYQNRTDPLEIYVPEPGVETIDSLIALHGEYEYSVELVPVDDGPVLEQDTYTIAAFPTDTDGERYGYALQEAPRRGRFDRDLAEDLGVSPDPDFTRLCNGEIVTTEAGDEIDPRQVIGDPTPGRHVVYTGDVSVPDEIGGAAANADLLIHEAAYIDNEGEDGKHATGEVAGRIAREADVEKLFLTNVAPNMDYRSEKLVEQAESEYGGEVGLASDGMSITLPVPSSSKLTQTSDYELGTPVYYSETEEGMYIQVKVARGKDSGVGLTKAGSIHVENAAEFVDETIVAKITAKKGGYATATQSSPPSGTVVHPYQTGSRKTKRTSKGKSTNSGKKYSPQKRVHSGSGSNPFGSGSNKRRDLVRKKH